MTLERQVWLGDGSPRYRVIVGAVEEAKYYPRNLCNQGCKTHLYFKNGQPLEQSNGERHDCPTKNIALMFQGKWNMIQVARVKEHLDKIRSALPHGLPQAIDDLYSILKIQELHNVAWADKFDEWKDRE